MRILTLVGPTAVGKTGAAIEIAQRVSGEIISADSRQIYKYLDIGTAKPTPAQQRKTRFHLIDFIEPSEDYSCGRYARDAKRTLEEIVKREKVPIVCGGTGLYIRALFHPLDELPQSDENTRSRFIRILNRRGLEHLYKKLHDVDPEWAKRIKSTDKQRILRGLEVYEMTGNPLSKLIGKKKKHDDFSPFYIGLNLPRDMLYARIDERFGRMIEQGLVEETAALLARGFSRESSALRTIGYKEIIEHLDGITTLEQAIEKAKRRTRNYAKRQLTWFGKIPHIIWCNPMEPTTVRRILHRLRKSS
jgi:tRNA dimethylallyltransferase